MNHYLRRKLQLGIFSLCMMGSLTGTVLADNVIVPEENNQVTDTTDTLVAGSGNQVSQTDNSSIVGAGNNTDGAARSSVSGDSNTVLNSSYGVAFGAGNMINTSKGTVALGLMNGVFSSPFSVAVGRENYINGGERNTVIGHENILDGGIENLVVGSSNDLGSGLEYNQIIGNSSTVADDVSNSAVIGTGVTVSANQASAVGYKSTVLEDNGSAYGAESNASGVSSTALGSRSTAVLDDSVALGSDSTADTAAGASGYLADGNTSSAWVSTAAAVSVGDTANGVTRQIVSVAAGTEDTDAVNVAQLKAVNGRVEKNQADILSLSGGMNRLGQRVDHVGAGAAALASLHPLPFHPEDKWDFTAGYGNYKDSHAAALGVFYHPDADTLFSMGGSFGGGENMVNAGISFKFGRADPVRVSPSAVEEKIKSLQASVSMLEQLVMKQSEQIRILMKRLPEETKTDSAEQI